MNVTKIMWAYLFMYGEIGTPSYYGGYILPPENVEKLKKQITKVGIDWTKTKEPKSDTYSEFMRTDCDSATKEYLHGVLMLKNGVKLEWSYTSSTINQMLHAMTALQNEVATNPIYLD